MFDLLIMVVGGTLLFFGGDWLVEGARDLALRLRLSTLLVSVVLIGFGTSAPELFVSLHAVSVEKFDISMGDVVGSNIVNFLLVLALTAVITPILTTRRVLIIDGGATVVAMSAFTAAALDGTITRIEAGLLLGGIFVFIIFRLRSDGKQEVCIPETTRLVTTLMIVGGLIALPLGARLFVEGAVGTARHLGVSEAVIGLTLVALGTSLPELATCTLAACRRHTDVAVGNILGSNMFNSTVVIGGASLLNPIIVSPPFLDLSLWVMMGVIVFSLTLIGTGLSLTRRKGLLMLGCYGAYVGLIAVH